MADDMDRGAGVSTSAGLSPEEFAKNLMIVLDRGSRAFMRLADTQKSPAGPYSLISEMGEAAKALSVVAERWLSEPEKLAEAQTKLTTGLIELWGRTYQRFLGQQVEPIVEPAPGDNRFKDPEWSENPFFDFIKQAYLLTSHWAEDLVESTEGLEERKKRRAEFYLEQILTALSPSNFPFTNPEVIRVTLDTNAENLAKGMAKLLEDLERSGDLLKIRQTDLGAFKVGENLAVTPGKVIFQNEIFQLIQYAPATDTVYETPLLIVPPWINKYYILDLVPEKSFVKWFVEQGFTIFMMSWVNPGPELADKSFEDYMHQGVRTACDVVRQVCNVEPINAMGYCVGGTLLATTLAYNAQIGDDRIRAAGFLTAQTDFEQAGDLLIFIDDTQLKALEEMMAERGYLDGSRMATVFNMLRPKDLIWPYVVNNYLLGKEPFPFDLLYWNSDSTRMPAANHNFYLRYFYHENKLARGEMEISGKRLDLGKVTLPTYQLATREDHIAPARSVFRGAKLFGGPIRLVIAGSGHIAGVVNPPAKKKYMHWTLEGVDCRQFETLDEWLKAAQEHPGSWWPDFARWLAAYSGGRLPARQPGTADFPPIEDAPGSYVKM